MLIPGLLPPGEVHRRAEKQYQNADYYKRSKQVHLFILSYPICQYEYNILQLSLARANR